MSKNNSKKTCETLRSKLLPYLQNIQEQKGFISDDDMQQIADELGIHPVEVYSVATFYSFFSTREEGKNVVRVSTGISCELKGGEEVLKEFEKVLKIKEGDTTKDKKFTLKRISCIGMCEQAPAIMINDELIGNVEIKDIPKILENIK
ncbi:NADH-quinone oxidoreductase subunit NuoE [bacterium]